MLSESSLSLATNYNNLGTLYYMKRDFKKSIKYYGLCLEIYNKNYNDNCKLANYYEN